MKALQSAYYQMLNALQLVTSSFESAWTALPSFSTPFLELKNSVLPAYPAAIGAQGQTSKGITMEKDATRAALETSFLALANAVEAYAAATGNDDLRERVHFTPSSVSKMRDDGLMGTIYRIADLVQPLLPALKDYGVDPDKLQKLRNATGTFGSYIGRARAVVSAKADATDAIQVLEDRAHALLDVMDAQMVLFRTSAPSFYNQYFSARKVLNPATHHRALVFTATDELGAPLEEVVIEVPALHLVKKTQASGVCQVQHAAAGLYVGKAWKNGYTAEELNIAINSGETTEVQIVLSRTPAM